MSKEVVVKVFDNMLEKEMEISHSHSKGSLHFECKRTDGRLETQMEANQLFEEISPSHSTDLMLGNHCQAGVNETIIKTSFDPRVSIYELDVVELNLDYNKRFNDSHLNEKDSFHLMENLLKEAVNEVSQNRLLNGALVSSQIPGNTGCTARSCTAPAVGRHLVKVAATPLQFQVGETKVKRAGLDYCLYPS
ncbi:hypothetical protein ACH5RR_000733 [Cinchona calisaya]|uniref:Uncharacterized protein n=1 Tax=Cinchona calisaya TaxID=153742 RepID=A0ABD3B1E8_9GENT